MKKIILLFCAIIVAVIVSCGSKKNNPDPDKDTPKGPDIEAPPASEANTLPKKVVVHSGSNSESYTIIYRSGSKKIDKITKSNGVVETYRYKGDLIERIDFNTNDGDGHAELEYDNDNKLIRETYYRSSNAVEKKEYTYPADSKITIATSVYRGSKWEAEAPITLEFDSKGNVVKGGQDKIQATVSYSDKNSPFLNVTGWSKINFTGGIPIGDNVGIADIVGRRNNPTHTKATEGTTSLLDLAFSYEFSDTDNAKFPTKITGKQSGQTAFTAEICYTGDCKIVGDPNDPNNPDGEDQPDPKTATLPLTIVMNSGGKSRSYTITYQENSTKIDKISESGEWAETYVYDGARIVKAYWGPESDNSYVSYSYDGNGRLTKEENHRPLGDIEKAELSYSGAKTTVLMEGVKIELSYDGKESFTSAALSAEGTPGGTITMTYDTKNAPFKDVLGWKQIRTMVGAPLGGNIGFQDIMGSGNNPVKLTGNIEMFGGSVDVSYTYEFKDSKHSEFPTKITGTKKVGAADTETFTAEITYK